MIFDPIDGIEPIVNIDQTYEVPTGKMLFITSTFENLNIDKKFDLVNFSESFQYVNIQKTLSKVPGFLNENAHFLICDFFRKPGTGSKLLGGGLDWDEFY